MIVGQCLKVIKGICLGGPWNSGFDYHACVFKDRHALCPVHPTCKFTSNMDKQMVTVSAVFFNCVALQNLETSFPSKSTSADFLTILVSFSPVIWTFNKFSTPCPSPPIPFLWIYPFTPIRSDMKWPNKGLEDPGSKLMLLLRHMYYQWSMLQ